MRLRQAEADKQRKLKEFDVQAKQPKQDSGISEQALRQKHADAAAEKQRQIEQMKDVGKTMSAAYNKGVSDVLKEKLGDKEQPAPAGRAGAPAAGGGAGRPVARNPSAIKQMLLDWCKEQANGYENVNITNFSSSWNDGMAFCALIHHFYPDAFDFSKLNPKARRANFKLAFDTAEKLADIAPLLDVEDMVRMKNPDWKCVFTYIQSFYRRFAMQKQ